MSDEKPQSEKSEQPPEVPAQSGTQPGTNIPVDLEAARRHAGRHGVGPYAGIGGRKRYPYSIM